MDSGRPIMRTFCRRLHPSKSETLARSHSLSFRSPEQAASKCLTRWSTSVSPDSRDSIRWSWAATVEWMLSNLISRLSNEALKSAAKEALRSSCKALISASVMLVPGYEVASRSFSTFLPFPFDILCEILVQKLLINKSCPERTKTVRLENT